MKINKDRVLQIIFTGLCAATFWTMFLPWFSVDPQMTGYYRGINAFFPAIIPFAVLLAYMLFLEKRTAQLRDTCRDRGPVAAVPVLEEFWSGR